MPKRKALAIGSRHGRLTIVRDLGSRIYSGGLHPFVEAKCDCGNAIEILETRIRIGKTRSCGCLRREVTIRRDKARAKTGLSHSGGAYASWRMMLVRCADMDDINYGGRGIKVCERWHDFACFFADMGHRPRGLTIDRINNDGNYEPGNCRWATRKEQAANTQKVKLVMLDDESIPMSEAARRLGYAPAAIRSMAKRRGLTYQEAVDLYRSRPKEAFYSNGRPLPS